MTIRPKRSHVAPPSPIRPRQIKPSRVWTTLSQAQQTAVLQEIVTMCQECLLTGKEASHDRYPPLFLKTGGVDRLQVHTRRQIDTLKAKVAALETQRYRFPKG